MQAVDAGTVEKIATCASRMARTRSRRSGDGRIVREVAGSWIDDDDIAQDAAVRAILAARRYDPRRGGVSTLAYFVAQSTVRDLRLSVCSRKKALPQEVRDEMVADAEAPDSEVLLVRRLDAERLVAAVVAAVGPSKARALRRWVEEGADGPMPKLAGEARLKDALCAARAAMARAGA